MTQKNQKTDETAVKDSLPAPICSADVAGIRNRARSLNGHGYHFGPGIPTGAASDVRSLIELLDWIESEGVKGIDRYRALAQEEGQKTETDKFAHGLLIGHAEGLRHALRLLRGDGQNVK